MAIHELPLPKLELAPDPLTTHAEFVAKRKERQVLRAVHYYPSGNGGGGGPIQRQSPEGGHILRYIATALIIGVGVAASILGAPELLADQGEKAVKAAQIAGSVASFVAGVIFELVSDALTSKK